MTDLTQREEGGLSIQLQDWGSWSFILMNFYPGNFLILFYSSTPTRT